MRILILFSVSFLLVYLIYLFFVILRKKVIAKYETSKEVVFLTKRYKINLDKIDMRVLANIIALINSFIIATTVTIISYIENIILMMLLGFALLIPFILICYTVLGKILEKKYGRK